MPLLSSTRAASKLAPGIRPRIPLLQGVTHVCVDDTLEVFLHHTGTLFGKDPAKWEQVGEAGGRRGRRRAGRLRPLDNKTSGGAPVADGADLRVPLCDRPRTPTTPRTHRNQQHPPSPHPQPPQHPQSLRPPPFPRRLAGNPEYEIKEESGKRLITETATLAGVQLHLYAQPPFWDRRLPPNHEQPSLVSQGWHDVVAPHQQTASPTAM